MPQSRDMVLQEFTTWAAGQGVFIHDAISLAYRPGMGTGIIAKKSIKKGTVLMRVPLSALLRPVDTILADELKSSVFNRIDDGNRAESQYKPRAHARLAAHLAFNSPTSIHPWTDTWPALHHFYTYMPIFWPSQLKDGSLMCVECISQKRRERFGLSPHGGVTPHVCKPFSVIPPSVTGHGAWCTLGSLAISESLGVYVDDFLDSPRSKYSPHNSDSAPLQAQSKKFALDLQATRSTLYPQLDFSDPAILARFQHAWCNVNTRCFYYDPYELSSDATTNKFMVFESEKLKEQTGQNNVRETDSDEKMVLVPFIDMFNHTSNPSACSIEYNTSSYFVKANRSYEAGEEVQTSYGPHGNDMLLVEYGFLMDQNSWDGVDISAVVLDSRRMTDAVKSWLDRKGYLGKYSISREGACWRTEAAARAVRVEAAGHSREWWERWMDGQGMGLAEGPMQSDANALKEIWVRLVRAEARRSLKCLEALNAKEVVELFEDDAQPDLGDRDEAREGRKEQEPHSVRKTSMARSELVYRRWQQIYDICDAAIDAMNEG